jgi:two-component system phosphate regulon sensor histidine kinase PhoR
MSIIEFLLATATLVLAVTTAVIGSRLRQARNTARTHEAEWKSKSARDAAEARDERARLLDALGDAFLLADASGIVRVHNAAASSLFDGRSLDNRPLREILLDPRLSRVALECIASGNAGQALVVLSQQTSPRGDHETRGHNAWFIDAARLPGSSGSEPLTRILIRDVTAEHQIEQIRKDFVANASHELRTPMAIINGYLENLLDDDMIDDPGMARRFLEVMRKHAERISRIVEDMLVISKLESGEAGALKIEPFPLQSCANDVLERLESMIHSRAATVELRMPTDPVVLQGDRFYWTQVLFNLVENALKQNPHPGLRIEIGCETDDDAVRVWVSDNGIGIPSADLPHIFRRFYRVEKHHSQSEIKGTGLGLSIVRRAVEAHGGTIGVTSTPGELTRFLIHVPQQGPASGSLRAAS